MSNKDQSTNPPPSPIAMPWPASAAPRSSPLFAPRPFDTRVSRQTAREAVTSNCRRAVTPASCRGAACLMDLGLRMERLSDGSIQYSVCVCFFVLCNRHWFNKAPGPDPRGTEMGVTYLPSTISSDAGYADLPLPLLGAPVDIEALVKLGSRSLAKQDRD